MKTIKELLNELPEQIASKAIFNTPIDVLELHHISSSGALISAFIWRESVEGENYWETIYNKQKLIDEMNEFNENHHEEQQWEADQEKNNLTNFED